MVDVQRPEEGRGCQDSGHGLAGHGTPAGSDPDAVGHHQSTANKIVEHFSGGDVTTTRLTWQFNVIRLFAMHVLLMK